MTPNQLRAMEPAAPLGYPATVESQVDRGVRIHREIVAALITEGFTRQQACSILDAISCDAIPHIRIDY